MKILQYCLAFAMFISTSVLADPVWIDVRSVDEYQADHIEGDVNMPFRQIGELIEQVVADKDAEIKLYCVIGVRAGIALLTLESMGYSNVSNVIGIDNARKLRNISNE